MEDLFCWIASEMVTDYKSCLLFVRIVGQRSIYIRSPVRNVAPTSEPDGLKAHCTIIWICLMKRLTIGMHHLPRCAAAMLFWP